MSQNSKYLMQNQSSTYSELIEHNPQFEYQHKDSSQISFQKKLNQERLNQILLKHIQQLNTELIQLKQQVRKIGKLYQYTISLGSGQSSLQKQMVGKLAGQHSLFDQSKDLTPKNQSFQQLKLINANFEEVLKQQISEYSFAYKTNAKDSQHIEISQGRVLQEPTIQKQVLLNSWQQKIQQKQSNQQIKNQVQSINLSYQKVDQFNQQNQNNTLSIYQFGKKKAVSRQYIYNSRHYLDYLNYLSKKNKYNDNFNDLSQIQVQRPQLDKQTKKIRKFQDWKINKTYVILKINNLKFGNQQNFDFNYQKESYFYIKISTLTSFQKLRDILNRELVEGNHRIKYQPKHGYKLYTQNYQHNSSEIKDSFLQLKQLQIFDKNQVKQNYSVQQMYFPGQTIYIELNQPKQVIYISEKIQKYPKIVIVNLQISHYNNQQDELNYQINLNQQQFQYSKIQNFAVFNLLYYLKFGSPLKTSLLIKDNCIYPQQQFNKIIKQVQKTSTNQKVQLNCIPINFLFYYCMRNIKEYQKQNGEDLRNSILKAKQNIHISDQQQYIKVIATIRAKIKYILSKQQLPSEYKDEEFLYPIVFYTSQWLYFYLNEYIRDRKFIKASTSITYIDFWYYSWQRYQCQKNAILFKLVRSLCKLPNQINTVYRVTCYQDYNISDISVNKVIQWQGFTSTYTKKQTALKNLDMKLKRKNDNYTSTPYIFQINSFSGKSVQKISYFENQSQVIILPLTKFRIMQVIKDKEVIYIQNKIKVTYVLLQQLQVPKITQGTIILWIDPNLEQILTIYKKIVKENKIQKVDIIQLSSNNKLKIWLRQYKQILILPNISICVVSNMNRPPNFKSEGLKTLQFVKDINIKQIKFSFFIEDAQETRNILQQSKFREIQDYQIASSQEQLQKIFQEKFLIN